MKCTFCGEEKECRTLEKCKLFFYQTIHVCKECSKKHELEGLLTLDVNRKASNKSKKIVCCPTCKKELYRIIKDHELGCPECFFVFKKEIIDMLWKKLPNIGYTGENKKVKNEIQDKNVLKNNLQKLLEQALEMEDYESVFYFSNEIRKMSEV